MNARLFKYLALSPLAFGALYATAAEAGSYGRDRYQPSTDYAQVLSARPIYSDVQVSQPRQECYDEQVVYRDRYRDDGDRRGVRADRAIGTVLGGVVGGVVGHQFGGGSGRQIATAVGAVIGAGVGRNAVSDSQRDAYRNDDRGYRERVVYEPRCRTVEQTRYEQRVDGYDVTYRYNGRVYTMQMAYDPGSRLPVQVDVSPLR